MTAPGPSYIRLTPGRRRESRSDGVVMVMRERSCRLARLVVLLARETHPALVADHGLEQPHLGLRDLGHRGRRRPRHARGRSRRKLGAELRHLAPRAAD